MSSIAAYPPGLDHGEDEELAPDDSPDTYAQHKASAERALFELHRDSGFPVVTFRPPFVHGPRQPFYREQFFWDRLLDGRQIVLPDGGETPMQWVFVDDVARACVRAIEVAVAAGRLAAPDFQCRFLIVPFSLAILASALSRIACLSASLRGSLASISSAFSDMRSASSS